MQCSFLSSFSSLLLVLALTSCQRENLDPSDLSATLRPGVMIPLGHAHLTLSDIITPDSNLITADDNGMYRLVYKQDSLISLHVHDLIDIPNQAPIQNSFSMGLISIPNILTGTNIPFGKLARHIANPPGFGTQIKNAHNTNGFIPAVPAQNPGDIAGTTIPNFQTASFASGSLDMKVYNQYKAPIAFTMALTNTTGTELLNYIFPTIAPGDSMVVSGNLAGKTIPNQLRFKLKNFCSPGVGTMGQPSTYVLIDTNDILSVSVSGTNLKVYNAVAKTSNQQITVDTLPVDFGTAQGVELEECKLLSGNFHYSFASALPEAIQFQLSIPGSLVNGSPWIQTITAIAGQTTSGNFSLAGVQLDLTQNPQQPFNAFTVSYNAQLISSGNLVTLDSSSSLAMTYSLQAIQIEHLKGFFGQDTLSIGADSIVIPLDWVNKLGGQIQFAEPSVQLPIQNSIGLPVHLDLDLTSYSSNHAATPLNAHSTLLPYPTIGQWGQTIEDTVVFDKTNTSIVSFLTLPKQSISYTGEVYINADTTANGRQNFISHLGAIEAGILVELPFYFTAQGIGLVDTLDISGITNAYDSTKFQFIGGELFIGSSSTLPLGVNVFFRFYDSMGTLVYSDQVDLLESGVLDPQTGLVTGPSMHQSHLLLDQQRIQSLLLAEKVEIQAVLHTAFAGTVPVKLLTTAQLDLHVGLQLEVQKKLFP